MYKRIYDYISITRMVNVLRDGMKGVYPYKAATDMKRDAWNCITNYNNGLQELAALVLNLGSWVIYHASDDVGTAHESVTWIPPKYITKEWYNDIYLPVMNKTTNIATQATTMQDWMETNIFLRFNDGKDLAEEERREELDEMMTLGMDESDAIEILSGMTRFGRECYTIRANFQDTTLFHPLDAIVVGEIKPLFDVDELKEYDLNWTKCMVMNVIRRILTGEVVDY